MFLVREQQFLELLEERKIPEALECLRVELTPIEGHSAQVRLRVGSSWVGMCLRGRVCACG